LDIARRMPDVTFRCWGAAVLDAPPKLDDLPANVAVYPPFLAYDELPLAESDGFIYTSAWDGLPTILIELGALGVPIVASAVGGVPELIDEKTGWPVGEDASADDYVEAIRAMLANHSSRIRRAVALQKKVMQRHSPDGYIDNVAALIGREIAHG
jgi:glycosyltransferase involved in cell wall biosynthesis